MLDIGWQEFIVILAVALLVIGPKDLPKTFHTVGKWVRAARKVTGEFQKHVDDMMREAELEDVRKGVQQVRQLNVRKQIERAVDPKGELKRSLDLPNKASSAKPGVVAGAVPSSAPAAGAAQGGEGAVTPSLASTSVPLATGAQMDQIPHETSKRLTIVDAPVDAATDPAPSSDGAAAEPKKTA